MAGKDKVYIDIIVDDNGTTQRVAVDSKKLGLALDDVSKGSERTGKSTKDLDRNLKGLSKQSANGTKNFSKMAQGMTGTLVPAYAILASNVFAITAAFQFLQKAADFRVIQESQIAFTGATGVGMRTLTADIQAASGAMLDFKTASESAAIGIASGLGSGQIEQLAAGAGNLSKILGRDVTDSFNRLVRGVTKAEPELLDELGITLRLADAQENYAATLGKSAKDLTTYEKKQAVFMEVQGQLESKYNAVAKATDVQANSVARLGVAFDKVMKPIKAWISAISEPTAEFLIKNIGAMTAALALLAIPIIRAIIPGTKEWAQASQEAADDASEAYKEAREEMKKLEKQQKDLEKTGGASSVRDAKPGSGVDILAKGGEEALKADKYAKNRIDLMLVHAERGAGAVRKMDKRTERMYILTLKRMKRGHATFIEKAEMGFWKLTQTAELTAKKIGLAFKKAFAGAKAAAASFVRGVDKIMSAAGWIGILMMAFELMKATAQALGFFKPNPYIDKIGEQFDNVTESLKTLNVEYKKFQEIQAIITAEQERTGKADPLRRLAAQAQFLTSYSTTLEKSATLLKGLEEGKFSKDFEKNQKQIVALEEKIANLREKHHEQQARMGAADGAVGMVPGAASAARWVSNLLFPTEEVKGLKSAIEELSNATAKQEDLQKKLKKRIEGTRSEQKAAAKEVLHYMNSMTGLTENMVKYKSILEVLAEGGVLSDQQIKDLAAYRREFEEQAKETTFAIEQNKELETSYQTLLSGITSYKTSVTELTKTIIENRNALIKQRNEQAAQLTDPEKTRLNDEIKKLNDKEAVLNRIRDLEVGIGNQTLRIQLAFNKALLGATPLQKEALQNSQKQAENNLKILEVMTHQQLAREAGVKEDDVKMQQYNLQLQILKQQNVELERAANLTQTMKDNMLADFETGLQKGIADVLKGDATVKEALAGMATSIASGMIDNVAKALTQDIMTGLGFETQEMKAAELMKQKTEEGIAAGAITLDTKVKEETAPAIAKKIEEGTANVSEGVKTAMTEGSTELATALQEVITSLIEQLREACHACMCPGEGTGITPEGTGVGENGSATVVDPVTGEVKPAAAAGGMNTYGGTATEWNPEAEGERPSWAGGAGGGEDESPVSQLNNTLKESNKITLKEVAGLGMAVTALLGNSKAGQALQKIMAAFYLFEMGKTVWEKGKALWEKMMGIKKVAVEGANTIAINANTAALAFNSAALMAPKPLGKTGIYPPLGYATGGIARGPMSGYPAVLHGSEAVVPLPNGKEIPVAFAKGSGPGMQTNTVGVTINMNNEGDADTDVDSDEEDIERLGLQIADLIQQKLIDEKRAGGILSPHGVT